MFNKKINPTRIAAAIVIGMSALSIPVTAQTNQNPSAPTNTQESPTNAPQSPGGTTDTPSNTTQPSTNQSTPTNTANESLLQVAQSSGKFTTFAQAVEAAGLANTLSDGSYTIFAPTDEAFSSSLPQGALQLLLEPQNKELLRQVLSYHVVRGRVPASKLQNGPVKTLGGSVTVRKTGKKVVVNDASVTQPDIKASNGVIHAVNRVLISPSLRKTIATKLQQETSPTTQPNQAPSSNQTPAPGQIPESNPSAPAPGQTP